MCLGVSETWLVGTLLLNEVQMFVHLSPLPIFSIVDVSMPSCKSTLTGAGEAVSVLTNVSWSLGKTRPTLPLTQNSRKYTTPQETVHKWLSWNSDMSRPELEDSLIILLFSLNLYLSTYLAFYFRFIFQKKRVKQVTWGFDDRKKKSRENDGTEREREAIVLSIRKTSLSLQLFVNSLWCEIRIWYTLLQLNE